MKKKENFEKKSIDKLISKSNDEDLWLYYGELETELKKRGLLRTRNVTAERGERLALIVYNTNTKKPNIQLSPPGTKNVDALSRDGNRYAIKTLGEKSKTTGTFQADDFSRQRFEYLIIVRLDDRYQAKEILEASWFVVKKFKKYHSTMKAFNISLTKDFLKECEVVFRKEN